MKRRDILRCLNMIKDIDMVEADSECERKINYIRVVLEEELEKSKKRGKQFKKMWKRKKGVQR